MLSIQQLAREEIESLIRRALVSRSKNIRNNKFNSYTVGLLFFEESTRTRVGFEAAAARLGAHPIFVEKVKFSSTMGANESINDTVSSIHQYFDVLCIRHEDEHIFNELPSITTPIINCGNGSDEHPVQALIDLAAMQHSLCRLDNIKLAIIGDLRFSRAAHSLLLALSCFKNIEITAISPDELRMPIRYKKNFLKSGNTYEEKNTLHNTSFKADVIYMTGFAPKTSIGTFSQEVVRRYFLTVEHLRQIGTDRAIVLCPLPRVDEIDRAIDSTPHAHYFKQSEIGLFVRMAVLENTLQKGVRNIEDKAK
jgi:aspartate carbamoyltransferase catalytic subunit